MYESLLDLCPAFLSLLPAFLHIPHHSSTELCSVSQTYPESVAIAARATFNLSPPTGSGLTPAGVSGRRVHIISSVEPSLAPQTWIPPPIICSHPDPLNTPSRQSLLHIILGALICISF